MLRVEVFTQGIDCDGFESVTAICGDVAYSALRNSRYVVDAIGRGHERAAAFALRAIADQLLAANPALEAGS